MSQAQHDAWAAGDGYELYMGRWSRRIAQRFLAWLAAPAGADWLEVGCGTGALTAAILAEAAPRSLVAIEPSDGFRAFARAAVPDPRARFAAGDASALPVAAASQDVAVSGARAELPAGPRPGAGRDAPRAASGRPRRLLRLGLPRRRHAAPGRVLARRRRARPRRGGPRRGPALPVLHPGGARRRWRRRRASRARKPPPSRRRPAFADFEEFWRPFTLGAGPAPGYVASLDPAARAASSARLDARCRGRRTARSRSPRAPGRCGRGREPLPNEERGLGAAPRAAAGPSRHVPRKLAPRPASAAGLP